jgi:uncharacterized protein (DUF58 family)
MSDEPLLLDEKTRRKLEQVMLSASRVRAGAMKGERRSIKRGTSIEFADYRNYVRGDDLRRLDWNIYGRLDRPFIKLLEDEEDLAVHLLLDVSASMDWPQEGERDHNKLLFAKRLFAGLAYISLASNDRMLMSAIGERGSEHFGPVRGRGHSVRMLRYVHGLQAKGVTDLNAALKDYVMRAGRPGLCLIISDMFSPAGYLDGLNTLLGKGYEVGLIHVLSPDEVEPPLGGDLRLIDVETNEPQEVTIDAGMRDLYIRRLEAWRASIREECVRRSVHYIPVETDMVWEKVILYEMRRLGLVK